MFIILYLYELYYSSDIFLFKPFLYFTKLGGGSGAGAPHFLGGEGGGEVVVIYQINVFN